MANTWDRVWCDLTKIVDELGDELGQKYIYRDEAASHDRSAREKEYQEAKTALDNAKALDFIDFIDCDFGSVTERSATAHTTPRSLGDPRLEQLSGLRSSRGVSERHAQRDHENCPQRRHDHRRHDLFRSPMVCPRRR